MGKIYQAQVLANGGWENRGRLYAGSHPAQNYIRKHVSGRKLAGSRLKTRVIHSGNGHVAIEGRG